MIERSPSGLYTSVFYVSYYCGEHFFAENSRSTSLQTLGERLFSAKALPTITDTSIEPRGTPLNHKWITITLWNYFTELASLPDLPLTIHSDIIMNVLQEEQERKQRKMETRNEIFVWHDDCSNGKQYFLVLIKLNILT